MTFTLLIGVGLLATAVRGLKSECSIPSVGAGETTTLTCKFEYDLKTHQHQFQVHRDCLRQSKSQETILFCDWKNGDPYCRMHARVTFDRRVTDQIQLQLRNVTQFDEGRYECVILPFSGDANTDCIFALKELEASSVKTAFIESTPHLQNIGDSNDNLVGTPIHVVAGVAIGSSVVSIIISVSITLLIIFCVWNRRFRFKNRSQTKHRYSKNNNRPVDDPQSGAGVQETEHATELLGLTPATYVIDERSDDKDGCAKKPLLDENIGMDGDIHVKQRSVSSEKCLSQCCKLENDPCSNLTPADLESRTSLEDLNLQYASSDYDEPQQSLNSSVVDLNIV